MHRAPSLLSAPRGALGLARRVAACSGAAFLLALACCGEPQVEPDGNGQNPNGAAQKPNDVPGNGNLPTTGGNTEMPTTGGNDNQSMGGNQPVTTEPNVTPAMATRFVGRVSAAQPVLSWPANAVEVALTGAAGTTGAFHFTAQGNVRMGLSIDGVPQPPALLQTGTPLSFGPLAGGNHVVRATMLNSGFQGTATYTSFDTTGTLAAIVSPTRRIAFIGDSIVAGYGVDGNAPCRNTVSTEDGNSSFAALTARAVQADYTLLAWPGKGLVRNDITDTNSTQQTMARMWAWQTSVTNANYTFPPEAAPQAVVIALGTNDYEYTKDVSGTATQVRPPMDGPTMQAALVALVNDVKARYPTTKVVLCSSPLLNNDYPPSANQHDASVADVQAVHAQFPNGDVVYVDLAALNSAQKSGCNGHPNRAAHALLSATLLPVLKQVTGW